MATVYTSPIVQLVDMPAVDVRRAFGSLIASEGVKNPGDFAVTQHGAGDMTVDVAAGEAYIADDHGSGGGYYPARWDAADRVTIPAADLTNPRIDLLVLRQHDNFLGDADNVQAIVPIPGTPAASPSAPAQPGSTLLLAKITVPAGATSIVTANIDTSIRGVRPLLELAGQGMTRLFEIALAADGAISFTSIPAGYRNLRVVAYLRDAGATDIANCGVQFNGDTGSNYAYARYGNSGGTAFADQSTSATSVVTGIVPGNSATSGLFGQVVIDIANYGEATRQRTLTFTSEGITDSNTATLGGGGRWKNTAAAISRVDLSASGTWKAGSVATLYGLR